MRFRTVLFTAAVLGATVFALTLAARLVLPESVEPVLVEVCVWSYLTLGVGVALWLPLDLLMAVPRGERLPVLWKLVWMGVSGGFTWCGVLAFAYEPGTPPVVGALLVLVGLVLPLASYLSPWLLRGRSASRLG